MIRKNKIGKESTPFGVLFLWGKAIKNGRRIGRGRIVNISLLRVQQGLAQHTARAEGLFAWGRGKQIDGVQHTLCYKAVEMKENVHRITLYIVII